MSGTLPTGDANVLVSNTTNDGNGTRQFLRSAKLLIGKGTAQSNSDGNNGVTAFSADGLRFSFKVERATTRQPNALHLKIYNLSKSQIQKIQTEYGRVVLSAGYQGNAATIFDGEIVYTMRGNAGGFHPENLAIYDNRESPTDTFLQITAADGQSAYNYAVASVSLAAGATPATIIQALAPAFAKYGVNIGSLPANLPTTAFPRGTVLHGAVPDILDTLCKSIRAHWSIQSGFLEITLNDSYIPGKATVISPQTGLIGMVRQELNDGISFTCLLNPYIRMGSVVKLNAADIQQVGPPTAYNKIDLTQQIEGSGLYKVIRVGHEGDLRGPRWYTNCTAIGINSAGPSPGSSGLGQVA